MNMTTNHITVRYFASIREAVGQGSEQVATAAATVGALRTELIARGGAYADCLAEGKAVRMARTMPCLLEPRWLFFHR